MKTFYAKNRHEWRRWLKKHHAREKEIWLVYYRKSTGKPRVEYDDAVEEALCFGWIDSQEKGIDRQRFAQRFSPRKPGSPWSETNKVRLKRLIAEVRMAPSGLAAAEGVRVSRRFVIPADIERRLKADPLVWRKFQRLPSTYRRIRLGFIVGARNRPKEFRKRLTYFLKMTARGKTFGYVRLSHQVKQE